MANYLDARTPQKQNAMLGEVMPPAQIGPGNFGQWSGQTQQKGQPVDPLRVAWAFLVKYAALFVVSGILSWGITEQGGMGAVWGLLCFGVVIYLGYFAMMFLESVFERDSGHVVWAFFGWLVERKRIDAEKEVAISWHKVQAERLRLDAYEQRALAARRSALVDKQATPQSSRNQLANYVEPEVDDRDWSHLETIPATVLQPAKPAAVPIEKDNGIEAFVTFLDFVESVIENPEATNDRGILQVGTPWGQRSEVPDPVKKQIKDMIGQFVPPILIFNNTSNRWKFNRDDYPDMHAVHGVMDKLRISAQ